MIRRIVYLLLALCISAVSLLSASSATAATAVTDAPETTIEAKKGKCLTEPVPASPNEGILGLLGNGPVGEDTGSGDPWDEKNPSNMIDVYGFNAKYFVYDTGCFPGSGMLPDTLRNIDNFGMSLWLFGEQAAYSFMQFALSPDDWVGSVDPVVATLASVVKQGIFSPWMPIGLLLAGAVALWAATKGLLSKTVTGVVWAIAVLAVAATMLDYPTKVIDAFDNGLSNATEIIAGANASDNETSEDAVKKQFEEVHRRAFYDQWCAAYFGDPESQAAQDYCPRLFKATHLSFDEAKKVDSDDADKRKEVLKQKKEDFVSVTDDISDNYENIYDSKIKGQHFHLENTTGTAIITLASISFVIAAGIWIALAFILIRLGVVILPIGSPIAVLEITRPLVTKFGSKIGLFVIIGPAFFVVSLLNLRFSGSVLRSELEPFAQLLVLAVITIILWRIFKPISAPMQEVVKTGGRKAGALAALTIIGRRRNRYREERYRRADGSKMSRSERKIARRDRKTEQKAAQTEIRDTRNAETYAKKETAGLRKRNRRHNFGERVAAGYGGKVPVPGAGLVYNKAAKKKRTRRAENERIARDDAKRRYLEERGYRTADTKRPVAQQGTGKRPAQKRGTRAADVAVTTVASGVAAGAAVGVAHGMSGRGDKKAASPQSTKPKPNNSVPSSQKQNVPGGSKWAQPAARRPFSGSQKPATPKKTRQGTGAQQKFELSQERRARVSTGAAARGTRKGG